MCACVCVCVCVCACACACACACVCACVCVVIAQLTGSVFVRRVIESSSGKFSIPSPFNKHCNDYSTESYNCRRERTRMYTCDITDTLRQ